MAETIRFLRVDIKDLRISLECKSCHSEVLIDPKSLQIDPETQLPSLRCPTCPGPAKWSDVARSLRAIVDAMSSVQNSDVVRGKFFVSIPDTPEFVDVLSR